MKTRWLIAVLVMMTAFAVANATPSRLQFETPDGWNRTFDQKKQVYLVIHRGANAAVNFRPTVEFAGSAEQWQEASWGEILKALRLAGPSQPGVVGPFLSRMAVVQSADGARPWICLYTLVEGGRGESAVYFSPDEKTFFAHLGTVTLMMQNTTVASGAANSPNVATKPAFSPPVGSAGNGDTSVDGLYLGTTRQLRLNPLGGSDWETRMEFYLLSRDGQVFRGRDLPTPPGGDINRFDYAAARREAPGNYGTYALRGDVVALRIGGGPLEIIDAKRLGPDLLEIRGTKFTRSGKAGAQSKAGVAESKAGATESQASVAAPPNVAANAAPSAAPIVAPDASTSPVLGYAEPAGFYRSAIQPPVSYTSNETNAGFEVYDFRPFTGDIVTAFRRTLLSDWIAPTSRETALAGAPEFFDTHVTGATTALAARFHENNYGQLNERMRMLVVIGNQAAIVDLHASSTQGWNMVGPRLGAMLDSLRIERAPAPPSLAGGPGPGVAGPGLGAPAVAGLYTAMKSKYMAGLSGISGSGGYKFALHYYVFSPDGRVYCCYDFPPGGDERTWRQFNFDAAQRADPENTGRYRVDGNQLLIQMSNRGAPVISARIKDANHLALESLTYERQQ